MIRFSDRFGQGPPGGGGIFAALADQWGEGTGKVHPPPEIHTPNMPALARHGLRLARRLDRLVGEIDSLLSAPYEEDLDGVAEADTTRALAAATDLVWAYARRLCQQADDQRARARWAEKGGLDRA